MVCLYLIGLGVPIQPPVYSSKSHVQYIGKLYLRYLVFESKLVQLHDQLYHVK